MQLLSIDVGIKNLAICILEPIFPQFEQNRNSVRILKWDIIDISTNRTTICEYDSCMSPATFIYQSNHFCRSHAKERFPSIHFPKSNTSLTSINKMNVKQLDAFILKYKLDIDNITIKNQKRTHCKADKLQLIKTYIETNFFEPVDSVNASKVHLKVVACNIKTRFTELISNYNITHVAIENQFGPLAVRMKSVQGMITQFFVMVDDTIDIQFVSSSNKLKLGETSSSTNSGDDNKDCESSNITPYAARKKKGIDNYRYFVLLNPESISQDMQTHFDQHPKQDDLADSFLQGMWVLCKSNYSIKY
jgi:hypothetical protein